MRTQDLWASLEAQPFPLLHELTPMDRDGFVLLDAYLRTCLEEWYASGSQLSARSVVLLDDCARSVTKRFRLLDGEGQYYFGQFRLLARRILHSLDVDQAKRELAADPGPANVFENPNAEWEKVLASEW